MLIFSVYFDRSIFETSFPNLVLNTGLIFGCAKSISLLISVFTLIGLFLVLFFYRNHPSLKINSIRLGFTLLLSGLLSNFYDRITLGAVRDYIYVFGQSSDWVINLADIAQVIGLGILFYSYKKFDSVQVHS